MRSRIKTRLFALAAAASAMVGLHAQEARIDWDPRSGDAWVDNWLSDINRYGARYREPFIDEMVRYYGAPRDLVADLLGPRRWAPGDVYYACAMAQVLGRPCRYVVDEWNRDHTQGWGAVAERLGVKPGSAEFHRIKRGFVPTYDRWGRRITIDADLRRDFPNREYKPVSKKKPAPEAQASQADTKSAKPQAAKPQAGKAKPGKPAPSSSRE